MIIIDFLFSISFNMSKSSFVSGLLPSNIASKRSLVSNMLLLFSTPIFSTTFDVCLIPAVSIKFISIPFITILPSTMSLVVPSTSVTIALSSLISLFSRLLFPTFGFPTIPTFIPFLIIEPFSLSSTIFLIHFYFYYIIFSNSFVYTIASSYSG